MSYLAADQYPKHQVYIYDKKPKRNGPDYNNAWIGGGSCEPVDDIMVYMLIGKKLSWKDEPVRVGAID